MYLSARRYDALMNDLSMKGARIKSSVSDTYASVGNNGTPDVAARAFAIPVLHALLITLALFITLALYVGMWREKIRYQDSELAALARQNSQLVRSIAATRKHAAELRSIPAVLKDEKLKAGELKPGTSKP